MAKLTAWLVTLIGAVLTLKPLVNIDIDALLGGWLIPLAVLVIGIGKLMRNYQKKRR